VGVTEFVRQRAPLSHGPGRGPGVGSMRSSKWAIKNWLRSPGGRLPATARFFKHGNSRRLASSRQGFPRQFRRAFSARLGPGGEIKRGRAQRELRQKGGPELEASRGGQWGLDVNADDGHAGVGGTHVAT